MGAHRAASIRAESVSCTRALGGRQTSRVRNVSLSIDPGTFTLVCGGIGCGKNLLLRLLGLLDVPDSGEIFLNGNPTGKLDPGERAELRSRSFGYLFLRPFLLPSFSVLENVAMPLLKLAPVTAQEAYRITTTVMNFTELSGRGDATVADLSTSEQHRAALARALVTQPEVLVVENIDAALNDDDLVQLGNLLQETGRRFGTTVIATVDRPELLPPADHLIRMVEGVVLKESVFSSGT